MPGSNQHDSANGSKPTSSSLNMIVIIMLGLIAASIFGGLASAFVVGTAILPASSNFAHDLASDAAIPSHPQPTQEKRPEFSSLLSPTVSPSQLKVVEIARKEEIENLKYDLENKIVRLVIEREKLRRIQEENAQLRTMLEALQEIDAMAGSSSGDTVGFDNGGTFV